MKTFIITISNKIIIWNKQSENFLLKYVLLLLTFKIQFKIYLKLYIQILNLSTYCFTGYYLIIFISDPSY